MSRKYDQKPKLPQLSAKPKRKITYRPFFKEDEVPPWLSRGARDEGEQEDEHVQEAHGSEPDDEEPEHAASRAEEIESEYHERGQIGRHKGKADRPTGLAPKHNFWRRFPARQKKPTDLVKLAQARAVFEVEKNEREKAKTKEGDRMPPLTGTTVAARLKDIPARKQRDRKVYFGTSGGKNSVLKPSLELARRIERIGPKQRAEAAQLEGLPESDPRVQSRKYEGWTCPNCAEYESAVKIQSASKARLKDISMAAVNTGDAVPKAQCRNCKQVYQPAGTTAMTEVPPPDFVNFKPERRDKVASILSRAQRRQKASKDRFKRDRDLKFSEQDRFPSSDEAAVEAPRVAVAAAQPAAVAPPVQVRQRRAQVQPQIGFTIPTSNRFSVLDEDDE